MLVYGDHADVAQPLAAAAEIRSRLEGQGCDRWALIECGRLVQALLDGEMAAQEGDECTPTSDLCSQLMLAIAQGRAAEAIRSLDALTRLSLPAEVLLKMPEGYAFYAVYPELYAQAAGELGRDVQAIGIRSIGTSLAAVVAASRGGRPPLFVRPVGDPFRRELRIGPRLLARLSAAPELAIVDEGPGLSGSSMLCVARELVARGVPLDHIHLFPSHAGGPGPRASVEDRALWERLPRHFRPFEALLHQLPRWCEDLCGAARAPLEDLGGGAWRSRVRATAPANVQQERRKYLLHAARGTFLLKFAGLGAAGEAVFRRARVLSEAGFSPPVLGVRNGFLVQPWVEARPVSPGPALEEHVARYLAFRSRSLPAPARAGAPPELLLRMARRNVSLSLGETAAAALHRWEPLLEALRGATVRIETDNRMHAWEWLRRADGALLKADAADHCRAHDLVGCQDAGWDLEAAAIELGLDRPALLRRFREHGGRGAAPEVLAFSRLCYLAFQLGSAALAADALANLPVEAARFRALERHYGALLAAELRA